MERPKQSEERTRELMAEAGVDTSKEFAILGIRGYYLGHGVPDKNDRGIYDDCIAVIGPGFYQTFNANTDPSRERRGYGTNEATKGMATLKPGLWMYRQGMHRGQYMALVQAADVTVIRDGTPDYEDKGQFGIHIHRGGYNTTSSEGCQTLHPDQWKEFFDRVKLEMIRCGQKTVPYLLVSNEA